MSIDSSKCSAELVGTTGPSRSALSRRPTSFRQNARAIRNIIDGWPEEVYEKPVVQARLLGQQITFVTDPECIRTLLVDDAHKLARDDAMTRALRPILGEGLLTSDGSGWRTQRRVAAPAFRPDRVRAFVPLMARAAAATRQRWGNCGGLQTISLQTEMMRTTFDIVVATMISDEGGLDVAAFGRALDVYLGQTNWKLAYSLMGVPAWLPHPRSFAGAAAAAALRSMTSRVIRNRRARGTAGQDLLGLMLAAIDPDTGIALSDEQMIDNLLTFVAAGHETTALAIAWTLRLLAANPEVERRVLDEIAGVPSVHDVPDAVDQLGYTRQVVFEAMRLYPPAALLVRRTTEEVLVGQVRIPTNGAIHFPIYALHRHRRLWNEPDRFDPDRFDLSEQKLRHRYAFLPFGAGPRVCIGLGMALTECLVVIATLLPAFRFRPLRPELPDVRFRVTLRPVDGMPVSVSQRRGG